MTDHEVTLQPGDRLIVSVGATTTPPVEPPPVIEPPPVVTPPIEPPVIPPSSGKGILIDPTALMSRPTTGAAWSAMKARADSTAQYTLASQDSAGNVACLARALIAVRTNDKKYRDKVLADLRFVMTTQPDRTLALGRELGAAPIAADLIGLTEAELPGFKKWLADIVNKPYPGGPGSLWDTARDRPNNWGCHAMGALSAVYVYLKDPVQLTKLHQTFLGWQGDRSKYSGFKYADLSWQADATKPVGINPKGATKSGHSIDGVLPDDQRRAGGFTWPPPKENYVWEALQGAVMAAHVLQRAGYPTWAASDGAIVRALTWLHTECKFPATGDDTWVPWLVNYGSGSKFPVVSPSTPGKNLGYTDWLFG